MDIDPRLVREMEVMNEIFKRCPPLTRPQGLARRQADYALHEKYPGQNVAYVDTWNGDELDRQVVAASADTEEFRRQLAALDPAVRKRVQQTYIRDPEEGLFIGGGELI